MMSRAERKKMILDLLLSCQWSITYGEIASGVGLAKSPYLQSLLDELMQECLIVMEWTNHWRYGRIRCYYAVREE